MHSKMHLHPHNAVKIQKIRQNLHTLQQNQLTQSNSRSNHYHLCAISRLYQIQLSNVY